MTKLASLIHMNVIIRYISPQIQNEIFSRFKVGYSKNLMMSWQLHGTTRETPHTNIPIWRQLSKTIFPQTRVFFEILSCIIHIFGIIYHLYILHSGDLTKYYRLYYIHFEIMHDWSNLIG